MNSKANQEVTDGLIQKTLQVRENALKNPRGLLWDGLQNYAVYGEKSPLMGQLSNEILKTMESEELQNNFQHIFDFRPQVLFYGQ